ncbi:AI-2E family transporter [Candidatus Woesearchaeota archaeon]|nr:AI-2E family transporter [Candidatus Woesearchaeota archaeon]
MLAVIIVLAIMIILPFLTPILTSFILAYIFYPIYKWLNKKIKRKNIAALIVSLILILLLVVPISFILFNLSREASVGFIILKQKVLKPGLFEGRCEGLLCSVFGYFKDITGRPEVKFYIEDSFKKISSQVAESTFNFAFSLPARIVEILLTFFFTFFLLRDGPDIVKRIEKAVPLKEKDKKEIIEQIHDVIYAVIYGFFVIAIIEGALGAITFKFFGVASPITWGIIIAFLTFVPFIGAAVIWVPAMIIQIMNGSIGNAVGILVGGSIIAYIDTFIKPRVIGGRAAIHPAITLIGLLGGLKLIGFVGIIIGPIVLSLFILLVRMLSNRK